MNTPLAWLNLLHQKKRTLVAVAGVAFAVLLIFMQLGFYGAAEGTATLLYDELNFDIILISPQYIEVNRANTFPGNRLAQALAVNGVAEANPLYVTAASWRNQNAPEGAPGKPQTIMVIAFRPQDQVFRRSGKDVQKYIDQYLGELQKPGRALIDKRSKSEFGETETLKNYYAVEIGVSRVELVGQFELGSGFSSNGVVLMSDETFRQALPYAPPNRPSLGLLRLEPGANPDKVIEDLKAHLPDDVRIFSRQQIAKRERDFWIKATSIGLIFQLGVGVALIVGVVFVYQVIASDISNRLHEFATLKAMGYGPGYLARTVLQQAIYIAAISYFPGLLATMLLYLVAREQTGIPIGMTLSRAIFVLVLTAAMCSISGVLALRKVQSADPADLF